MEDDDFVVKYHFENHETGEVEYSSKLMNNGRN